MINVRLLLLLSVLLHPIVVTAQQDDGEPEQQEERLRQKFRDDMAAIVDDLNSGSFEKLVRAIDRDDMLERIFGLRLIDPRTKREFRDEMEKDGRFERFVEYMYRNETEDGMHATLLLVESRGDRGRAVVRFDMPHFQVNYHEYELRIGSWNRVNVVDWKNYLAGSAFSDDVGFTLVQGQPNKNAVRKLIDFPSVREQQVFQVMEVLKAARDRNFDRYFEIYDALEPSLQRQRAVLLSGLNATRSARKRRSQRKILVTIAEHYPEDPLLALSLLDYYFPDKQYANARDALLLVKDTLGIDEAVMNARLSSTYLVMADVDEAARLAAKAVSQEPGLELAWWAVLRAEVAAGDFDAAIPAVERLQSEFGHELGPDALSKDPSLVQFVRSQEYRSWYAANGDSGADDVDD